MGNRTPLLVIAAGGTGGHMFPAQALAEEMLARGWRVKLSTDTRGARYAGGFPDAVEVAISASGTRRVTGVASASIEAPSFVRMSSTTCQYQDAFLFFKRFLFFIDLVYSFPGQLACPNIFKALYSNTFPPDIRQFISLNFIRKPAIFES